jgi:hypothetical protein
MDAILFLSSLGVGPREVLGFRRKELSNEALLALRMMFLALKTLF